MMVKLKIFVAISLLVQINCGTSVTSDDPQAQAPDILTSDPAVRVGADNMEAYLPLLGEGAVGLVVNHTSTVKGTHLVDTLLQLGIDVRAIFAPEHGFRGTADAGEKLADGKDPDTGLPVLSLYGKNRRPRIADMQGLDWIIFDIQDVGARFYTYISTMHHVMDVSAELGIRFMVLDRPNPNGHYVDGPILDTAYRSFVGMHPIPVVHGMTVGEYARMVNGEGWLSEGRKGDLTVIPCEGYTHQTVYELPVKPSPNLPNMRSIYLYPSLCFFEGTVASEGRGTHKQFQVYGHPDYPAGDFTFTPRSLPGAQHPKLLGKTCHGHDLTSLPAEEIRDAARLNLSYVIDFYRNFPDKDNFFLKNRYFDTLAGSSHLREQIVSGKSEEEIRAGWQAGLERFRQIRKQYLLYPE